MVLRGMSKQRAGVQLWKGFLEPAESEPMLNPRELVVFLTAAVKLPILVWLEPGKVIRPARHTYEHLTRYGWQRYASA